MVDGYQEVASPWEELLPKEEEFFLTTTPEGDSTRGELSCGRGVS